MTEGEGRQPDGARFDEAPLHDAEFHEGGEHAAELLRAIVRISPLSMVLTDPNQPDYPMVFCNRAFTRLTGYTEEEVTGRNCRFLQGPDTDPAAVRVLGDAVRAGAETQVDLWNYRKDGSRFWNSMFIGPVHDAQGKLLYYFGSQVDSSARRAAEEAANRERRLDTLGAMAAGLAHEINNLMTVVVGNAEGLKKAIEGDAALERLRRIEWASLSAGKLTRQLLAFAGRQGLQAETVDLNGVLLGLRRRLGDMPGTTAMVELALHPEPLLAVVDPGQLELAIINLVRNAADASPPGSRIVVAASVQHDDDVAAAKIAVIDTGCGMSPEITAKALDPFFTTKKHGKGTGLGLSMVAGFCRESGGRMSIQSNAGTGTMVSLAFPLAKS